MNERMAYIDVLNSLANDMEDGAYFAYMADNGVTMDELIDYSKLSG